MKRIIISLLIMSCVIITDIYPDNFRIIAKIETVRKDNHITLLFDEIPAEKSYYIIENQFKIGSIEVINIDTIKAGSRTYYRVLAVYTVDEGKNKLIRAGADVGLDVIKKQAAPETEAAKPAGEAVLPQKIISEIDKREMLLVLGGKFLMGSDTGDRDEYPERIIHVSDFYIDRFEVPNSAYLMYIKEMNLKPPALWKDGKFTEVESDFPVMVAYSEAEGYAKWAEKRLPSEEEWEKAARGEGFDLRKDLDEKFYTIKRPLIFPWGNSFNPEYVNSREFWDEEKSGLIIKKIYTRGPLPVSILDGQGNSPYGIVNMSGNAPEWTSGWYRAYPGNNNSDSRYGKQVKVIRGGAWYSDKYRVRVTSRDIGGVPNIYNDCIAGFRCVKDIKIAK